MKSFLTDAAGKPSHHRLLVAVCVPPLVLVPLAVWAILCLQKGELIPISPTIPLYMAGANGVILGYAGYKAAQEGQPSTLPPGGPST